MEGLGIAFKRARESKNMLQKEVAKGIISTTSLSKFESGTSIIGMDKFILLLERIRMSYQEFSFIFLNQMDASQSDFLLNLHRAKSNKNVLHLQQRINIELELFNKTQNIRHQHNVIIANQTINQILNLPFDSLEVQKLYDFLFSVVDWGYYEITLFGNIIFCLDIQQIKHLSNDAVKKAYIYRRLSNDRYDLVLLLQNIASILIKADMLTPAMNRLQEVDELLSNTQYLYEINRQQYLYGLYYIKLGDEDKGLPLTKNAIDIYTRFNLLDKAFQLQTEVENILKNREQNN